MTLTDINPQQNNNKKERKPSKHHNKKLQLPQKQPMPTQRTMPNTRDNIPSNGNQTRQQQQRNIHRTHKQHLQNTIQRTHQQLQQQPPKKRHNIKPPHLVTERQWNRICNNMENSGQRQTILPSQ